MLPAAFLLPGISCQTTVLLTVLVKLPTDIVNELPSEYHNISTKAATEALFANCNSTNAVSVFKYVPYLQAHVSLRDMKEFLYFQRFPVSFSPRILVRYVLFASVFPR